MSESTRRGGIVAKDGSGARITPEQLADYGVLRGAVLPKDRPALLARAMTDPVGTLTSILANARPDTPATPATPGSGPSVAAGSAVPTAYPSSWGVRAAATVAKVADAGRRALSAATSTEYPPVLASAVEAGRRGSGVRVGASKKRAANAVRAQGPIHDPSDMPRLYAAAQDAAQQVVEQSQSGSVGFYDKSLKASSAAAEQQARYDAELAAMRAEQKARGIG